jgi:hypothetical protein
MNPVAWLVEGYDGVGSHIRTVVASKPKPDSWVTVTPLYTAPRELSDDEIEGAFYKQCWYYDEDEKFDYYGFAKEILKRASEK